MTTETKEKSDNQFIVKNLTESVPLAMAALSIWLYMFFLKDISNISLRGLEVEFLNIMGREIPIQVIMDNSLEIGISLAMAVFIASFITARIFAKVLRVFVRAAILASDAIDNSFYGLLYRDTSYKVYDQEVRIPFVFVLSAICGLLYLLIYIASAIFVTFRIFFTFLGA